MSGPFSGGARLTAYVALLRAVNVAGHQMVAMVELRNLLDRLGYGNPRTLLQSGNAVFTAGKQTPVSLERALESAAKRTLRLDTPWFVRTAIEWRTVIAGNPFVREAETDPGLLHVMLLKARPALPNVRALQAAIKGPEVVRAGARHLYITYPDGAGRSRLTSAAIERFIGTPGTARNWNTVLKLSALLSP